VGSAHNAYAACAAAPVAANYRSPRTAPPPKGNFIWVYPPLCAGHPAIFHHRAVAISSGFSVAHGNLQQKSGWQTDWQISRRRWESRPTTCHEHSFYRHNTLEKEVLMRLTLLFSEESRNLYYLFHKIPMPLGLHWRFSKNPDSRKSPKGPKSAFQFWQRCRLIRLETVRTLEQTCVPSRSCISRCCKSGVKCWILEKSG